jgi:two-component system, NarL family, response regulator NreC
MNGDNIRVLLVDDHMVVRAGLRAVLSTAKDVEVVSEAASGSEAIALATHVQPDVVVMDVSMGEPNGLAATPQVLAVSPSSRVLILTMHGEDEYLTAALQAGASGYLVKSAATRELVDAVRAVARGDIYVQPAAARVLARRLRVSETGAEDRSRLDKLSNRERDVLRLVGEGYSAPDIAMRLGISAKTVDTYRHRIGEKLGLFGRPDYVRFALRTGLLTPDRAKARSAS